MDSILTSIKQLLNGIPEDCTDFDGPIIAHINSAFFRLHELGAGPESGFYITDKSSVWRDFINDDVKKEWVKTYIYLKVKLVFDPPQQAALIESIDRQIKELEWLFETEF